MLRHRESIEQMKSELLDLWVKGVRERSYFVWYELVNEIFQNHFNINQTDFFIYNKERKIFSSINYYQKSSPKGTAIDSKQILNVDNHSAVQYLQQKGFQYADDFIVFKNKDTELLAMLIIESSGKWTDFSESIYINEFKTTISGFMKSVQQLNNLLTEGEKFRLLFNITESFTSTMTSESILDLMMKTVREIIPTAKKTLLLSHEQPGLKHSYKIFNQEKSTQLITTAFLSGTVTTEINEDTNMMIMNTPINGRQGVYGVLKIEAARERCFSSTQRNLIQMLVNTAGNALENATLYNQSYQLNEDLRLINETSQKLNSGLSLKEMLVYLKSQIQEILKPSEVLFAIYNESYEYELMEVSPTFSLERQGQAYVTHILSHVQKERAPIFKANFKSESIEDSVYKSIVGIPILNQKEIIGVAIVLHKNEYSFSFDSFKLMESLIIHASLSISNLQLREKMRDLAEKDYLTGLYMRRYLEKHIYSVIEQKKGGSLLLFDIDDFKLINDNYGHGVGDKVLKQVGSCLLEEVDEGVIAARWGGEEFAVYFPERLQENAKEIAQLLLKKIPAVTDPFVTVSMGLVEWQAHLPCSFKTLFNNVDRLLYQAKDQGKNKLLVANENIV